MKKISEYAYKMKKRPTRAERILRKAFRKERLAASPQKILGYYIFDFFVPKIKVLIEVDGGYHNLPEQIEKDAKKQKFAETHGYHVFRVKNEEIEKDIQAVIDNIMRYCEQFGMRRSRFYTTKKVSHENFYKKENFSCANRYHNIEFRRENA